MPRTAKRHSWSWISAYSCPPTNIRVTPLSSQAARVPTTPSAVTTPTLRSRAERRADSVDIDGNATTTTNWGRNSTAFTRIRPPAYRPASWASSTLRATITSALESAKKASSACELRAVSPSTDQPPCPPYVSGT